MKVFVAGATGAIGKQLVPRLVASAPPPISNPCCAGAPGDGPTPDPCDRVTRLPEPFRQTRTGWRRLRTASWT